jgi:hypothetical protein
MTAHAADIADHLGITTPTASALIDQHPDPGDRRQAAARAVLDRRGELVLLAALIVERDGQGPTVAQLERADVSLADLTVLAVA